MKFFPESTLVQLEFEKIKDLLVAYCRTAYAKDKAAKLRLHTQISFIELELQQTNEFLQMTRHGLYFPQEEIPTLDKEIKLLGIPGAVLSEDQLTQIRRLADALQQIFRWFDNERREAYPGLARVIENTYYEKAIIALIDDIIDENGQVRDNASEDLAKIRLNLYKRRNELRRVFDRIVQKLSKQGYVADIEEAFLNGRRVVAVFAEQKRQIKGILHGESDTRKTAFIEPEETIELNNEIFTLENEENREVYRILRELTARLAQYAPLLKTYHQVVGLFDFIRAKAKLANDMDAVYPIVHNKAHVELIRAYHPLLLLYNRKANKVTVPVDVKLDAQQRILVISGPNAGGKTVTMKTVGLLQLMLQSGLLVPVHPYSQMGVFKQLMIHIGDTQSLEFELSTYSSHLKNMKYFIENANGKTLFFIDELGSGSDPNLGGAFAEVIMEELGKKHAMGIVTTHYLNLKVMANKTPGIINGAMAFDENTLLPLYKLLIGKPGSSYTFSIAERIGLDKSLINRAKKLVDDSHFKLDHLLNKAEQDLRTLDDKEKHLNQLLKDNERMKKDLESLIKKEKHYQQIELLKHQNKVSEDRIAYLKDMERKLKQMVSEWRKATNDDQKLDLMKSFQLLLFKQQQQQKTDKAQKKINKKYEESDGVIEIGAKVLMKKNHQVGEVKEIRGKKAVVQLGLIPLTVDLSDLVVVVQKENAEK